MHPEANADPGDWDTPPIPATAEAEAAFHRVIDGLINDYPYVQADWENHPPFDDVLPWPHVRLYGPAINGPVLCLMLIGDNDVFIIRGIPGHSGWQGGRVDLSDLEDVTYDFARDHFETND